MRRLLALILAALALPAPAVAQAWPGDAALASVRATAVTAPGRFAPVAGFKAPVWRDPVALQPTAWEPTRLRFTSANEQIANIAPRAKVEWTDDQGFRLGGKGVAYKRRF